jgi:Clustered mitochondria
MQQGYTRHLHASNELAELAEAEAAYRRLCEDFRKASLYAVHIIVKKSPTPLNLFNLYGDDGDKYVIGGILIRRAKDWSICG